MLVRLRNRLDNDGGSTLVVVLVIMLVLTVGGLTLAAIVTSTTNTLVNARGTAQSRAAADAGIASAVAAVRAGTGDPCETPALGGTNPTYTVTVTSCDRNAKTVTFTSVGTGENNAVSKVQAVFSYSSSVVDDVDGASHMTFFGNATFTYETQALSTGLLNIAIPNGNFTCQATVYANIIVSGNFVGNGSCDVKGSVIAGGTVTTCCTTDRIRGNVVSAGTAISGFRGIVEGDYTAAGAVTIDGGATGVHVKGDLQAGGAVRLYQASVGGKLTLPPSTTLCVGPSCATTVTGSSNSQVGGGIYRTAATPPPAPSFNPWFDYLVPASGTAAYTTWAATDWPGYTTWTLSSTECSSFNTGNALAWNTLGTLTTPTIIDARKCPSNSDGGAGYLTSNPGGMKSSQLKVNIVFLATGVKLTNLTLTAAAGASPKVWFVVPDPTNNDQPDASPSSSCYWGDNITINGTNISVPTMAYTPGCINVTGGGTWRGALYGGAFSYGGALQFWGESTALPGMPNAVVSEGSGSAAYTLGPTVSQRDVP